MAQGQSFTLLQEQWGKDTWSENRNCVFTSVKDKPWSDNCAYITLSVYILNKASTYQRKSCGFLRPQSLHFGRMLTDVYQCAAMTSLSSAKCQLEAKTLSNTRAQKNFVRLSCFSR